MHEIWMPSPCYSSSRGPYNKFVFHTAEGAQTIESLGNFFANGSNQVSSHFGIDNHQRGVVGSYVMEHYGAWTQGNANPYCISVELCGFAKWSRDYWLDTQDTMLDNAAELVRWMCDKYGIPLRTMSDSQAQDPGYRGVCQHIQFGAWGGGHVDCGSGFPLDIVLERAANGTTETGGIVVAGVAFDSSGRPWEVGSWKDNGQINVKIGDDASFAAIDKTQTGAIGSPSIAFNPADKKMRAVYINSSGKMCAYDTNESPVKWYWKELGGNFQA